MAIKMNKAALEAFLADAFPQVSGDFGIVHVTENAITVRLITAERH